MIRIVVELRKERSMKRLAIAALMILLAVWPSYAKTHKEMYSISCATLWPAVKDTLRNSGKYGILNLDNEDMTASFNIGGTLAAKRTNSVVLNGKGDNSCEMQIQTAFSGITNNDEGDFKKRVDASLDKLKSNPPSAAAAEPAKPDPNNPK
jgi:hypothetical protein